jgi:carboxypeptidase C (cathepsin A)
MVINLPRYPYQGRMFSGYLSLNNPKKKLHYMFIESEKNPRTDPLILWLNGGPGCSSLLGWAQEHGPASMKETSDEFYINPYSWHKAANMIYLESPAGVGFSYIDSKRDEDLAIDDHISGKENLEALLDFFRKYINFKNNDFYVAGESYAGIYVPYLASNIIDHNKNLPTSQKINFKGIIVGNGVTDWKIDTSAALVDFAYSHALYSPEVRQQYLDNCSVTVVDEKLCKSLSEKIEGIFKTVNIYDVYRKCYPSFQKFSNYNNKNKSYNYTPWLFKGLSNKFSINKNFLEYLEEDKKPNLKLTPPCTDSFGPDKFFNDVSVKLSLNVRTDLTWEMCSEQLGMRYKLDEKASYYLYPKLITSGLRILIFSGDTDGAVPYNGSQKWISNLKLPVKSAWRSWRADDANNIAGYRTIYEGLTFVTVKGTGHMVPQWKPKEAFYMLKRFLAGQDL